PLAFLEIAADQQPEAARKLEYTDLRFMLRTMRRFRFVQPPIGRFRPPRFVENARRKRGDVAGQRFAGKCRYQIETRSRASPTTTRRRMPPSRYCSDRPVISASTVSVICSVIRRRVLSAK